MKESRRGRARWQRVSLTRLGDELYVVSRTLRRVGDLFECFLGCCRGASFELEQCRRTRTDWTGSVGDDGGELLFTQAAHDVGSTQTQRQVQQRLFQTKDRVVAG